jgi:glycosyltransferase involved in cell wall biosynthesis
MNILILTHSYPDVNHKWRGIFIQEQARALSAEHNITVVYFKVDYSRFAPFARYTSAKKTENNYTLYEVTCYRSFPVITQLKYLSDTYKFLNNEIFGRSRPDIIHSHLSYPAGFLGAIIRKRKGIPSVLTEHSRINMYFRSFIHKRCVIYALKNSNGVISVSNALKKELVTYCRHEVNVIPNIVDTELFEISPSSKQKVLNIGFLGSLNNSNKGLDIFLRAASMLVDIKFSLHIGGAGSLLENYKKLAEDLGIMEHCKFYGEIPRDSISDFYLKLDVFVLPSRYETFGIVLIEAMAAGVPVISTRCGGPEDNVTPLTGLLAEKEDPEDLARAITVMAENIQSYNRKAIRDYATNTFGKSVFINRITSFYNNILRSISDEKK